MPKKARKSTPKDSPQLVKKARVPSTHTGGWISALLFAIAAGACSYVLSPVLAYADQQDTLSKGLLILLCAIVGFIGETSFFRRYISSISVWILALTILQLLANLSLLYSWFESNPVLLFFTRDLTIPIGVAWFFILRHGTTATTLPIAPNSYRFKEVFNSMATRVVALIALAVATGLFFYRLGYFDIWEDENLVINAAVGVMQQGLAYFKEGYDRAALHTLICAGVFEMFGVSEYTARIPSAIFGLVFVAGSLYVFARWYGIAWLAILIPLVCLMNDRFLILFRYMRMYALLIPLFLGGVYLIHRTLTKWQEDQFSLTAGSSRKQLIYLLLGSMLCLPLLAHVHKLSMVLLPVFACYLVYMTIQQPTRRQWTFLGICAAAGVLLLLLTFVVELGPLKMFRQAASRILTPHDPKPAYFQYMFENGLTQYNTIMFLIAGLGLLGSKVMRSLKSLLLLQYLLIFIPLVLMVYLADDQGKDYRYIAHIVPFVVSVLLLTGYGIGKTLWSQKGVWVPVSIFFISTLQLWHDADRVYIKHPWAPGYSEVYSTLKANFHPDDALFVQNVKTFYLDPEQLAGSHFHKVPKKRLYTLDQFIADVRSEKHGWVMWELHKSYQWQPEILDYIYARFKPYHSQNLDDLGVELFYFDETILGQ